MFSRIVVGIDGHDGGTDAMELAEGLAAAGAQIILVNAYPYEDERASEGALRGFEELLRDEALERLRAVGGEDRFTLRAVPCLSPARALHAEAERADADLIVVGSCRRGALGRMLLGDVSRAVLHGARCPVAVAPSGQRDAALVLRSIGVGVHDTDAARAALAMAAGIAAERDAQLRLLSAVHGPVPFAPADAYAFDWTEALAHERRAAQERLDALIGGLPVPATAEVVEGSAGEALVALSHAVDLLVLGSRSWGAVRRVVLGSTADRVIHGAACPVLLATAPPG